MSDVQVIEITNDVDFNDIQDTGGDILKEDEPKPDKAVERAAKEEAKLHRESMKMQMRMNRDAEKERAREEKAEKKEKSKLEKVAGLYGGTDAQVLRAQIVRYRQHEHFGPYLKSQGFSRQLEDKVLMKMDAKQLNELKDRIKFSIANKNSGKFYKTLAVGALKIAEPVGEKFGAKIKGVGPKSIGGLADCCDRSPEFHDLLDEIFMEYNLFGFVGPEKRLLMFIVQTAYMVHGSRAALESMTPEQQEKIMKQLYESKGIQMPVAQPNVNVPAPAPPNVIEDKYNDLLKQY